MIGRPLFLVFALVVVSLITTPASAQRCYKKVGSACVKSSTGYLDSSCTYQCAIGKTPEVESIQRALRAKGYNPGPIDGIMGPKTEGAFRAFQMDHDLPETESDIETLEKLGVQ